MFIFWVLPLLFTARIFASVEEAFFLIAVVHCAQRMTM